ncbi:MAG: helix-turn-helix transcriptional regulator [Ruminococcaceae bacterium]|nr:helix-turn-helix transcriptional regulator [Oscillospiraceae bacterium]
MYIKIGAIIKKLRAENNITQDTLATAIGVTPQAISRWESEGGYPDIELLPMLADFFSVSTDELLGYKLSEREQELANVKKELERLAEVGSVEERVAYARNAFARYPNDYEIRDHLAVCLYDVWQETHDEVLFGEIESLLVSVANECTDENTRYDAINTLIMLYGEVKQSEKAKEWVNRLTPMKYCRETALSGGIGDGKTKYYIQDEIDKLTESLGSAIQNLVLNDDIPNDSSTWENKIEMLNISNQMFFLIYGDDLMYHHSQLSFNYWIISTYQMSLGRTEEALEALEKMCHHAVAHDLSYQNDHGKHFISLFVDTQIYPEKSKDFHELTEHTQCYYRLDRMQNKRYDCIRQDPRFISIIEKLNQYAK